MRLLIFFYSTFFGFWEEHFPLYTIPLFKLFCYNYIYIWLAYKVGSFYIVFQTSLMLVITPLKPLCFPLSHLKIPLPLLPFPNLYPLCSTSSSPLAPSPWSFVVLWLLQVLQIKQTNTGVKDRLHLWEKLFDSSLSVSGLTSLCTIFPVL